MSDKVDTPRVEVFLEADFSEPLVVPLGDGIVVLWTRPCPDADRPNEDALCLAVLGNGKAVLAVADGAGGQPLGNKAAALSVQHLMTQVVQSAEENLPLREGILRGFEAANQAVIALGVGAASTLVCAEVDGRKLRTYHAGDSRALVCGQRGRLKMLSAAHSPVGYQVQAGLLDEGDALHDGQLHEVSNIVGASDMRVEIGPTLDLSRRDTVVLGSDGLFDNLDPQEIVEQVRKGSLAKACRLLIDALRLRMDVPEKGLPSKPDDCALIAYRPQAHR